MLTFLEGTVFNSDAEALVNTVNCTGIMGAGIALEFKLRYPEMFKDYEAKCKNRLINTGKVDYFQYVGYPTIVNFPTKWHFKYPSKLPWIEQGLQHFVDTYKNINITSVAFPKLGTNKGGLSWTPVKDLMVKYLSQLDIDVYICLDCLTQAEGVEKIMLDSFNSYDINQLSEVVKLKKEQKEKILARKPFQRFWKIAEIESIGIKTYSNIFKHFYDKAIQGNVEYVQSTIDDYPH